MLEFNNFLYFNSGASHCSIKSLHVESRMDPDIKVRSVRSQASWKE